jgi:hypothetical protein
MSRPTPGNRNIRMVKLILNSENLRGGGSLYCRVMIVDDMSWVRAEIYTSRKTRCKNTQTTQTNPVTPAQCAHIISQQYRHRLCRFKLELGSFQLIDLRVSGHRSLEPALQRITTFSRILPSPTQHQTSHTTPEWSHHLLTLRDVLFCVLKVCRYVKLDMKDIFSWEKTGARLPE